MLTAHCVFLCPSLQSTSLALLLLLLISSLPADSQAAGHQPQEEAHSHRGTEPSVPPVPASRVQSVLCQEEIQGLQ